MDHQNRPHDILRLPHGVLVVDRVVAVYLHALVVVVVGAAVVSVVVSEVVISEVISDEPDEGVSVAAGVQALKREPDKIAMAIPGVMRVFLFKRIILHVPIPHIPNMCNYIPSQWIVQSDISLSSFLSAY